MLLHLYTLIIRTAGQCCITFPAISKATRPYFLLLEKYYTLCLFLNFFSIDSSSHLIYLGQLVHMPPLPDLTTNQFRSSLSAVSASRAARVCPLCAFHAGCLPSCPSIIGWDKGNEPKGECAAPPVLGKRCACLLLAANYNEPIDQLGRFPRAAAQMVPGY